MIRDFCKQLLRSIILLQQKFSIEINLDYLKYKITVLNFSFFTFLIVRVDTRVHSIISVVRAHTFLGGKM